MAIRRRRSSGLERGGAGEGARSPLHDARSSSEPKGGLTRGPRSKHETIIASNTKLAVASGLPAIYLDRAPLERVEPRAATHERVRAKLARRSSRDARGPETTRRVLQDPMEDVYDMYRDGVEENSMVWIDSSNREDTGDGEHTISLTEPFRNVTSVRVIEATVPATHLSIDFDNRVLAGYCVSWPDGPAFVPDPSIVVGALLDSGISDDASVETVHDRHHRSTHAAWMSHVEVVEVTDASRVPPLGGAQGERVRTVYLVPGDATRTVAGSYDTDTNSTIVVGGDRTGFGETGTVATISVMGWRFEFPVGRYDSLRDFLKELEHGYTVDGTSGAYPMKFVEAVSAKPERTNRVKIDPKSVWRGRGMEILPGPNFWMAVDLERSTSANVLGIHENPSRTISGKPMVTSSTDPFDAPCVVASSMFNPTAERYVWLRCKEVESHMCTGVGRVLQRGIGVFRLDLPGDFKEEKTEYVSLIPSRFHPISRLDRLTLRFEKGNDSGTYDFRGIQYYLLLAITTIKRDRRRVYSDLPRTLNPGYDPAPLHRSNRTGTRGATRTPLTADEERRAIATHNLVIQGREVSAIRQRSVAHTRDAQ